MRTTRTCIAAGALLALASGGMHAVQASPATSSGADNARSSANLQYIGTTPGIGAGGTDFEFFSRTLTAYKDRSGEMITPDGPVERHFAMVGNQASGAKIVDVTEPEKPYVAAAVNNCTIGQGDIQITNGGTLAAIAKQGSGTCRLGTGSGTLSNGSALVDLADPYAPKVISFAVESSGSHNHTFHPGGKFLYISTSALAPTNAPQTRIPIFDVSVPTAPKKVMDFMVPGNGPHDIRFSHDGKRAYFAGVSAYYIVNTENPAAPSIITAITPPGGTIGHDTLITKDKRFLFLGDEAGGGGTYPCPGGAVYVYDLTVETAPVLLGLVEAGGGPVFARDLTEVPGPATLGGCTSHVMDLNPDGKSLTLGWYKLGSRVFDFSSFYNADGTPKTAGVIAAAWGQYGVGMTEKAWIIPDGANTWSAKQYSKVPGYIFSDDLVLGFYVSKFKG